jgi:hypothetical protein
VSYGWQAFAEARSAKAGELVRDVSYGWQAFSLA